MTVQSINFFAKWDSTNSHLRTPPLTTVQKVCRLAWNILSVLIPIIGLIRWIGYAAGCLANRMTLPIAHDNMSCKSFEQAKKDFHQFWMGPITDDNRLVRAYFTSQAQPVTTPDGVLLSATLIRHCDANESTPTVIFFNGNFQVSYDAQPWLCEKSIERATPCNFVIFDYRGVGDSKGRFKASKDLIIDGSSIVQYVREHVGTPPDQIRFYGLSLGGAVAAETQALDPKHLTGRHLNERSFSTSDKMVEAEFGRGYLSKLISWIFKHQGYYANPAAAFRKIQGEKLVIYHPNDLIIPYEASLQKEVQHDAVICLKPRPEYAAYSRYYHHTALLEWHTGAIESVTQFLLSGFPGGGDSLKSPGQAEVSSL